MSEDDEASTLVTFEFVYTLEHLLASLARYRRADRLRRRFDSVKYALTFVLIAGAAWIAFHGILGSAVVFGFLGVILLASRPLGELSLRRSTRRSPFINQRYVIRLDHEGLAIEGALDSAKLKWGAFTKVRAFPDGLLLFTASSAFRWLPFGALTSGESTTARVLAFSNVANSRDIG